MERLRFLSAGSQDYLQRVKDSSKNLPSRSLGPWKKMYQPCHHPGKCNKKVNCPCSKIGRPCEKYCGCFGQCDFTFPGCECPPGGCPAKKSKVSCLCASNFRDCDPVLCRSCGSDQDLKRLLPLDSMDLGLLAKKARRFCPNTKVLYQFYNQNYEIRRSNLCDGMGLYASEAMREQDHVGEYVGVYLDGEWEFEMRQTVLVLLEKHFGFQVSEISITIDASYFGNATRYINHNINEACNIMIQTVFCQGIVRLIFVVHKALQPASELYFDYGKNFNVPWKKEF